VAVFGLVDPVAFVVEVFVTDDFARDVARRLGRVAAAIAIVRPRFECGTRRQAADVGCQAVEAGECTFLVGAHTERLVRAGDLGFAVAGADDRAVGLGIDLHGVVAGMAEMHGGVRRLDLDVLALAERAHAHRRHAFGQAHLHDVVIELDEFESAAAIEMHAGGADLQFGPAVRADH
jgi:hypothetical protein